MHHSLPVIPQTDHRLERGGCPDPRPDGVLVARKQFVSTSYPGSSSAYGGQQKYYVATSFQSSHWVFFFSFLIFSCPRGQSQHAHRPPREVPCRVSAVDVVRVHARCRRYEKKIFSFSISFLATHLSLSFVYFQDRVSRQNRLVAVAVEPAR